MGTCMSKSKSRKSKTNENKKNQNIFNSKEINEDLTLKLTMIEITKKSSQLSKYKSEEERTEIINIKEGLKKKIMDCQSLVGFSLLKKCKNKISEFNHKFSEDLKKNLKTYISELKLMTVALKANLNKNKKIPQIFIDKFVQLFKECWNKNKFRPLIDLLQLSDILLNEYNNPEEISSKEESPMEIINNLLYEDKLNDSPWPFLRKRAVILSTTKTNHLDFVNLSNKFEEHLNNLKNKYAVWKSQSKAVKLALEGITLLIEYCQKNKREFFDCFLKGRFDKEKLNGKYSIVLGDYGGAYLLLNSAAIGSLEEEILLESGVSRIYLNGKRNENKKITLMKGNLGKIRYALSLFSDQSVDIGQVICLIKSHHKNEGPLSRSELTSFVLDFCFPVESEWIYDFQPFDTAVVFQESNTKHSKGYLFIDKIPEFDAKSLFTSYNYKKWEYCKPYILQILENTYELLLKKKIFCINLRKENTFFNPISKLMTLVPLDSIVYLPSKSMEDLRSPNLSLNDYDHTRNATEFAKFISNPLVTLDSVLCFKCAKCFTEVEEEMNDENENLKNIPLLDYINLFPQMKEKLKSILVKMMKIDLRKGISVDKVIKKIKSIDENVKNDKQKGIHEEYIKKLNNLKSINVLNMLLLNKFLEIQRLIISSEPFYEQSVVQRNPNQLKQQATTNLSNEVELFFKSGKQPISGDEYKIKRRDLFVLLGDPGSGKTVALLNQFIKELENWKYGMALPVYINMAHYKDFDQYVKTLKANLSYNINLQDKIDEVHLFLDDYDENFVRMKENKSNAIELILESLKNCKIIKIMISCRIEFVENEMDDDFREFKLMYFNTHIIRFINPVIYGSNDKKNNSIVEGLSKLYLSFAGKESDSIINLESFKMVVRGKIKTVSMLDITISLISSVKVQADNRLTDFEILKMKIHLDYSLNWKTEIAEIVEYKTEKIDLMKEELKSFLCFSEKDFEENTENDIPKVIIEGLERIGELIAVLMMDHNSSYVLYKDLENTIYKGAKTQDSIFNPRIESQTLYQILKIMGLCFEKRGSKKSKHFIQFRHRNYKYYYLLRGLIRILNKNRNTKKKKNIIWDYIELENKFGKRNKKPISDYPPDHQLLKTVLNRMESLKDSRILRFFGEYMKFKDGEFRENLYKELEQIQRIKKEPHNVKLEMGFIPAVIISFLNAGGYSFSGKIFQDLDLSGAFLRGGLFYSTIFERCILRNADFRHANLTKASFIDVDLRNVQLGVWPVFSGHTGSVNCVCFSPDEKQIVSCSSDKTIKIWDSTTGDCLRTLEGHSKAVYSICFGPDSETLISGGADKLVKVWNILDGLCLYSLEGHEEDVNSVCFSPDIRIFVSGGKDKTLRLWEGPNGKCVKTIFSAHENSVLSVCFIRGGENILSGGEDKAIKIWDSKNFQCLSVLSRNYKQECVIYSICSDSKGEMVAFGFEDRTIDVWDGSSEEILKTIEGDMKSVLSVSFSSDGKILSSGTSDEIVRVFDTESGECFQIFKEHKESVRSVCVSPSGKTVATGSSDKTVRIFSIMKGDDRYGQIYQGHDQDKNYVSSVSISWDGSYLANTGEDGTVKLWDITTGVFLKKFEGHKKPTLWVSFRKDGLELLSCSHDETIKIWNINRVECVKTLAGHKMSVLTACFSSDGEKIASGSHDETVKIWESATGICIKTLLGHKNSVVGVAFFSDAEKLTSGSGDGTVKIWDCSTGECLQSFTSHTHSVTSINLSKNEKMIASGESDFNVIIWKINYKTSEILKGHSNTVSGVCFLLDDLQLASCSKDFTVKIWNIETGCCIHTLEGHHSSVNTINFNLTSKILATGDENGDIHLWQMPQTSENYTKSKDFQEESSSKGLDVESLSYYLKELNLKSELKELNTSKDFISEILNKGSNGEHINNESKSQPIFESKGDTSDIEGTNEIKVRDWIIFSSLRWVEGKFVCSGSFFKLGNETNALPDGKDNQLQPSLPSVITHRGGKFEG